jgi:hypothetical protein
MLPELYYPYGRLETSALADVKAFRMRVPALSALLQAAASLYMSPQITGIYFAISTVRMEIGSPVRIDIGSGANHSGQTQRYLPRESIKLALRLAYLGQKRSRIMINKEAAEGLSEEPTAAPNQLYECLRLTALLFVWRFQRRISVTSRPMRLCHGRIASLLKSMELKSVFMKPEGLSFGANLLL